MADITEFNHLLEACREDPQVHPDASPERLKTFVFQARSANGVVCLDFTVVAYAFDDAVEALALRFDQYQELDPEFDVPNASGARIHVSSLRLRPRLLTALDLTGWAFYED